MTVTTPNLMLLLAGLAVLGLAAILAMVLIIVLARRAPARSPIGGAPAETTEGLISIGAALLVLFSAMLNPSISVGLAVVFLIGLAGYKPLARRAT
jgi:hypothetical protein